MEKALGAFTFLMLSVSRRI